MRFWTLLCAAGAAVFLLGHTPAYAGDIKELTLKDGRLTQIVSLTKRDDKDEGKPAKIFAVKLEKDKTYQFDLTVPKKKEGDPYLRLRDSTGKEVARDDDGGEGLNARIVFKCPEEGTFRVVCTTFAGRVGVFTLRIQEK